MKFVFFNIGWMERYKGLQDGDEIIGGGSYVKIEGCGHEVCNFAEVNGTLYGYVQPPGSQIDIDRLGAQPDDDEISTTILADTVGFIRDLPHDLVSASEIIFYKP